MSSSGSDPRVQGYRKTVRAIAGRVAQAVSNSMTLLGLAALIPGISLPPELTALALTIGIDRIGSLLDKVSNEEISNDQIVLEVEKLFNNLHVDKLLTGDDFFRAISKIIRNQDKLYSTTKGIEVDIQAIRNNQYVMLELLSEILLFSRVYKSESREIDEIALSDLLKEQFDLQQKTYSFTVQKARSELAAICPRVFTIDMKIEHSILKRLFSKERAVLTLWCEAPNFMHTAQGAKYEVALKNDELSAELLLLAKYKKLSINSKLNNRVMSHVLKELDPYEVYGGLVKVLTPQGDYLWLCKQHAHYFK